VLSAIIVAFLGVLAFAFWPTTTPVIAPATAGAPDLIEKGRYLAVAGDCTACHTAPGGRSFAGGRPIASPIGTIYSTNITPDRTTGIGAYSLTEFDRAVRAGISPRGTLYPAMPYPSYAHMSDQDIAALYAYFMHGVAPVHEADPATTIPWPMSIRWPLAIWRKLFAPKPDAAFDAKRYADPAVARGAYLVQGPGHCGSCHTPRALSLQEKSLDESGDSYLAGGPVIDGWVAVNLRGNAADGLGSWSRDDIIATLRSGRNAGHAVIGESMNDVVLHSTQFLNDEDLEAIAAYLKSLPALPPTPSAFAADPGTARALAAGKEANRGAELYIDNCAGCHRSDGAGYSRVFPRLAGNSTVLSVDPTSLVRLILHGSQLAATTTAPSELAMPGFGWRLSDHEVAQLASFVRESWGNHASAVPLAQAKKVRTALAEEPRPAAVPESTDAAPPTRNREETAP
jgi:mono/diheme cytochrome c family protein